MDDEFAAEAPDVQESGVRLATAIDPRIAEVWTSMFASDLDPDEFVAQVGWFLRMAYLRGYHDGLCEPEAGSLYKELGIQVPPRRQRAVAIRHGSRREES
ncbi:MAG: hypothetical protein ACRDJU_08380 [Actinomycetota bacterium]